MNLLILGGSGHVSGTLARVALERGDRVWAVTRGRRALPGGVVGVTADRKTPGALAKAVESAGATWDMAVDCIAFDDIDARQDVDVFSGKVGQFVAISTDFVYDPAQRRVPQSEDDAVYARGESGSLLYGQRKRAMEVALLESGTNLSWTVLRPCHIYGPGSQLGCLPEHGRDPKLIERLRNGDALRLVGGGAFLQQPILAGDLARTILSVAGNKDANRQIVNAAGPDTVSSRRYYEIVAEILGVELSVDTIDPDSYRESHPDSAPFLCDRVADLTKLDKLGLHVPNTALADGLQAHVAALDSQ